MNRLYHKMPRGERVNRREKALTGWLCERGQADFSAVAVTAIGAIVALGVVQSVM